MRIMRVKWWSHKFVSHKYSLRHMFVTHATFKRINKNRVNSSRGPFWPIHIIFSCAEKCHFTVHSYDSPIWRPRSHCKIKLSRVQLVRWARGQSTTTRPPCAELDLQCSEATAVKKWDANKNSSLLTNIRRGLRLSKGWLQWNHEET